MVPILSYECARHWHDMLHHRVKIRPYSHWSGSLPDSSEPYASASGLHSHYKRLTRRERYAPTSPCKHCVCFVTVVTQLHVLNSWHMSPFRVMWIVSVEINRSVCRHAQTVCRSLPDAPDASLEHSHCRAKPTRTVRIHCEHILVWSECTGRTPSSGRSVYTGNPTRTVRERYARMVKSSVYTRPYIRPGQCWPYVTSRCQPMINYDILFNKLSIMFFLTPFYANTRKD